jgi:hypothetical protein
MSKHVLLVLLLCSPAVAQKSSADKPKPAPRPIPTFDVKFEPDPKLSLPFDEAGSPAIFAEGCDANGSPYVRVNRVIPPGNAQVLKFDAKGIITFETSKISDIIEPKSVSDFAADSDLYMLVEGDTRTERRTRKLESGENSTYWEKSGEPKFYIARFDADGSYKGATKLDLPFRPQRLSGFKSGDFLASGLDENHMQHVALLDWRGQWLRDIEFPKEKKEPVQKTFARVSGLTASSDLAAMMTSGLTSLFQYRGSILYIRGRSDAPSYEIHDGGEVILAKIKSPDGYAVDHLLPSDRSWIVVSSERGKFTDAKSVVYEVNPSTNESIGRYLVEGASSMKSISEGQSDLACFHDGEFVAVRHQDGKLTVLHGLPVPAKSSTDVAPTDH